MERNIVEDKKLNFEKIVIERILKNNKDIFTKDEIALIENNIKCVEKIYLIGLLDNLQFNAIFNATPKKSCKKRDKNIRSQKNENAQKRLKISYYKKI